MTHYGVPAELPEARRESLLSPPVPGKAINAPGSGRRPSWVNLGLGIEDGREIGVPWHSWRFERAASLSFDPGFGICGNRRNLRFISPLLFAWFAYLAVE